jgi:hypothetical protein
MIDMMESMRKYVIVALIGCSSFILGYIGMYGFIKYVIGRGSGTFLIMAFNFCVTFLGVILMLFYMERSKKSISVACIIALLFMTSLRISRIFIPQYMIIHFHIDPIYLWHRFYIDWNKLFIETFHVHIIDFLHYIVISIFFGLLSVPVLWKRKRYIPLIMGIMLLGLMLSLAIPNGLGLPGGWTHTIIGQGILGVLFSVIVVRFYWDHTINYYDSIGKLLKKSP